MVADLPTTPAKLPNYCVAIRPMVTHPSTNSGSSSGYGSSTRRNYLEQCLWEACIQGCAYPTWRNRRQCLNKQRSSWRKIGLSIMGFIGRATGAAGTLSGGNSSAATPEQSSSRGQAHPLIVTNTHLYVWCGWMRAVTDFDK